MVNLIVTILEMLQALGYVAGGVLLLFVFVAAISSFLLTAWR